MPNRSNIFVFKLLFLQVRPFDNTMENS